MLVADRPTSIALTMNNAPAHPHLHPNLFSNSNNDAFREAIDVNFWNLGKAVS